MANLTSLRKDGYFVSIRHEPDNVEIFTVDCSIYVKDYDEEKRTSVILLVDEEYEGEECQVCHIDPVSNRTARHQKEIACPLCGQAMNVWSMVKRTYSGTFTFSGSSAIFLTSAKGMPTALAKTICNALSS